MKTLIMTAHHSGTHLLLRFLAGVLGLHEGYDDVTKESSCDYFHLHPSTQMFKQLAKEGKSPSDLCDTVIITLRHPHKSARTGKLGGATIDQLCDIFKSLHEEKKNYKNVLYLVIDGKHEYRYPQLKAIADHFGVTDRDAAVRAFAKEWPRVNESFSESDAKRVEFATIEYERLVA